MLMQKQVQHPQAHITKLLSQKGDFGLRLLVENVFTASFKLTNALIKPYFMI